MDEFDTETTEGEGEPKRNFRRVLEDKANEAETRAGELEAELSAYKRNDAFRSAGIDAADPRQAYFVKGYDGEMDAEAIREAAVIAGFIGGNEAPVGTPGLPEGETLTYREELQAQQRVAEAGFQGQPVQSPDLEARIRQTSSSAELKALLRSEGVTVNTQG